MSKTNSEQFNLIVGSLGIQAILLFLASFFVESVSMKDAFWVPLGVGILFYLPGWLILKVDFISKIFQFLSDFFIGLYFIGFIFILFADGSIWGNVLLYLWFGIFIITFFSIADEELKIRIVPSKKTAKTPTKKTSSGDSGDEPEEFFVTCVNCGEKLKTVSTANLCPNCGKDINKKVTYKTCKSCGSEIEPTASECQYCGAKVE